MRRFAALTGYEAAVGETARLTDEGRELDMQEAEGLNRALPYDRYWFSIPSLSF